VPEHDLSVIEFHVLVEADAGGGRGENRSQRGLAHLKRVAAKVVAIQLHEIEGVEEDCAVVAAVSDAVEGRESRAIIERGDDFYANLLRACVHTLRGGRRSLRFGESPSRMVTGTLGSPTGSATRRGRASAGMGTETDVLIVGAGPSGLVLALWLTHLGVKVRIVDKAAAPATTSRALVVHARTMNGELNVWLDEAEFLANFPLKGAGRARFIGMVKREAEARRDLTFDDVSTRLMNELEQASRTLRLLALRPGTDVLPGGCRFTWLASDDIEAAVATYWAACRRWPRAKITLRQAARIVHKNW
jgi:hypothetical protein